jgi:hypothetical protein
VALHGLNLDALLAVLATALLLVPVHLLAGPLKGPMQTFLVGLGLFLVGAVMRAAGRKPSVLFIPIWLTGLGGMAVGMVQQWGWWTLGLTVGLLFACLAGLATIGWRIEAREWRQAPAALEEAKLALLEGDEERAWRHLELAAYAPGALHLKVEMVRHARSLGEFVREHLEARLAPGSAEELRGLLPQIDPDQLSAPLAERLALEKRLKALQALVKRRGKPPPPSEPAP